MARKTAQEREKEGALLGGAGVLIAVIGLAGELAPVAALGGVVALLGLVMWGAAMARPD